MDRYNFSASDETRYVSVQLDDSAVWTEVAEEFFSFLQGCGFVLTRADFAEYWSQYLEPNRYSPDSYWSQYISESLERN